MLFIHIKPYESELSTALSECKAVAQCATRKTDTAINRIKTVGDIIVKQKWFEKNSSPHVRWIKEVYSHSISV